MEVARLQVAFEATGQPAVQRAVRQTDQDINRLADNSERAGRRMGNAFEGAGRAIKIAMGAVAAIGAGKAALGFLNINAQAEQLKVQLDIATGSAERAQKVFGELQAMAAETPFEFPELVSASARIEAFGIDSLKAMQVIGDTAAGTGKSIDQVTNAYLDAGMGQFIRLQELGIDAAVEGDKVKFKWIENGKEITKEVDKNSTAQIQATLSAIWNKKYEGAMKKQSRTFNGQLSTLKDNWNLTMGRLTAGFFDFTKGVLGEGNEFFNLFNRKLDQGLDPWHAALSALHVTLDQVLGKTAGDLIIGTLRGITDGAVAVAGAIGTVTDILGAMGGALRIDLANGDIGAFFADLQDDLDFFAAQGLKLFDVAVDVASWAIGKIPDLWGWLKGVLGVTSGGFAGVGDGTGQIQPVTLTDVLVDVGSWAAGEIADLVGWLTDHGKKAVESGIDLAPVVVRVTDWTMEPVSGVTRGDIVNAVKVAWTFDPIEITPEIKVNIHDAFERWTTDFINNPPSVEDIGKGVAAVSAALIGAILFPVAVPVLVSAWITKNVVPDLASAIGSAISGVWDAVKLNTDIGAKIDEILFGGSQLQLSPSGVPIVIESSGLVDRISQAIGNLKIPLPSWDLLIPSPSDITNVGGIDLAVQVPLWISGKLGSLGKFAINLLSWDMKLPTPGFPDLDNHVVVVWIEDALDALGQFLTSIMDGNFSINVPTPQFPNLTHTFVWDAIQAAITTLGEFAFDLSVKINIIPNISTGGLFSAVTDSVAGIAAGVGGTVQGRAGGGFVRESMTLVGERGPELVSLPRGSYVHTAAQTAAMARGSRMARGGSGNGGDTYYLVDLSNAVVGRGAMQEIQKMIADGSVKTYDGRSTANRLAGR